MERYILPTNEGPVPNGPTEFRRLDPKQHIPELEDISRESFVHLGDWYSAMREDGCGVAYRIGVKEDVIDSDGDPATAMIMFFTPIAQRDKWIDDAKSSHLEGMARRVLEAAVIQASAIYGNVMGVLRHPPEYMLGDLKRENPEVRIIRR